MKNKKPSLLEKLWADDEKLPEKKKPVELPISAYVKNALADRRIPTDRISKYREEFGLLLIEHMAMGYTYNTFAAIVNVTKKTLENWESLHDTWKIAKELAEAKALFYYENLLKMQAEGTIKGDVKATMFILKNLSPSTWKDKTEVDHSGEVKWVLDTGIRRPGDEGYDDWTKEDAIETTAREVTPDLPAIDEVSSSAPLSPESPVPENGLLGKL